MLDIGDAAEVARFHGYVVRGPAVSDCWIWTGSIADDAYGRFWLKRNNTQRVVRPHRYALALALGRPLEDAEFALHEVCDNPICVRASDALGRAHVVLGTQAQNLAGMGAKGRGGGKGRPWRRREHDRAGRVARSRRLREAVRHGWDDDAVRAALWESADPTLF